MVVQILNKPKPKYTIGEIRYRCLTDYSWSKSRSVSLEYKIGVSSGNLLGSFKVSCSSVIRFPCWLSKYRKKNHGPPESCMLPEFFIFLFSCNALLLGWLPLICSKSTTPTIDFGSHHCWRRAGVGSHHCWRKTGAGGTILVYK